MFKVFALSKPATKAYKPKEDKWGEVRSGGEVLAIVADGVTQPTDEIGVYPSNGWYAADICVEGICGAVESLHTADGIRETFENINNQILDYNRATRRQNIINWHYLDRICTTAALVSLQEKPDGTCEGWAASIGDAVILQFSETGIKMLSRDQLKACHAYSRAHFAPAEGQDKTEAARNRLAWQRSEVRNNPEAVNPDTGEKIGFGVLDGNPRALQFLDVVPLHLTEGSRIIVASDAIRVLSSSEDPDDPAGYEGLLDLFSASAGLPGEIIGRIREEEVRKNVRSDDATILLIESTNH